MQCYTIGLLVFSTLNLAAAHFTLIRQLCHEISSVSRGLYQFSQSFQETDAHYFNVDGTFGLTVSMGKASHKLSVINVLMWLGASF